MAHNSLPVRPARDKCLEGVSGGTGWCGGGGGAGMLGWMSGGGAWAGGERGRGRDVDGEEKPSGRGDKAWPLGGGPTWQARNCRPLSLACHTHRHLTAAPISAAVSSFIHKNGTDHHHDTSMNNLRLNHHTRLPSRWRTAIGDIDIITAKLLLLGGG